MKKIILFATALFSLNACQEVIEIDLNQTNPQYVIIGNIADDGKPCSVEITKTVNFSEPNNFPKITGAIVTLSDDKGSQEILSETKSGIYESKKMLGVVGNTYTLTVKYDGQTFISTSKMADATPIFDVKFIEDALYLRSDGNRQTGVPTKLLLRFVNFYPHKIFLISFLIFIC